ncbi:hypothetical protein MAP00_008165 [Monascus purpureus]|nr:hypothetical protein MAP00_008165 [Monascus purpureus]
MPEIPESMQDNIAHLERQAPPTASLHNPHFPERASSYAMTTSAINAPSAEAQSQDFLDYYASSDSYELAPSASGISPFPVLRNPPPNVPPTDGDREANLERARLAVLSSNDPEMQLAWAQDALAYVEIAMQNEARLSLIQPPRPQTPVVERQLKSDAMNIVNFLADQYHPKAEFIRGTWLEFGKFGYRMDKKEAFLCYSRASEKGYPRAEYRMGMQFENSNEPEKAIKYYEKGVALGDSASYYRLGMMILLGQHGQRQDYHMGLDYIRVAAQTCDQNAPQGAYVYGMLLAGELPQVNVPESFLPLDMNAARVNIEKAAYHGFAKAQVKMGAAYELCQLGCDFNPMLSLHYNALAARQGEPEAEMALSKWFLCGHEGVFEKNDELAFTYAQRAAQSGLPTAEFALGYFYEVGIFVPVDIKEARSWYSKAATGGNKDASSRIESISRSKTLSRKDHERVAIARIKSRYGSQARPTNLGPTPEKLEMPDPSRMSISDSPSASSTPYYNRPDSRVSQPSYPMPDPRPSSAFGFNPNLRASAASYGVPPQAHRAASYGPGPVGYQAGPGAPPSAGTTSPSSMHPRTAPGTPRLDIGFSAPLDSPGPRLNGPPDRRPARTPVGGHPQNSANAPRPGGLPPRVDSAPPPRESPSSTPRPSKPASAPRPSAPPSTSTKTAPPAKSQTSRPPNAPTALPGKGPKTFEEMGVPTVKSDNDCVVM